MLIETYGQLREAVRHLVGWGPRLSSDNQEKFNNAVRMAWGGIIDRDAGARREREFWLDLGVDQANVTSSDTMALTDDAYVVKRAGFKTTDYTTYALPTDGTAAFRVLRLIAPDKSVYVQRIREIWDTTVGDETVQYISLFAPFAKASSSDTYTWLVVQDRIVLPKDVQQINSVSVVRRTDSTDFPLSYVSSREMEGNWFRWKDTTSYKGRPDRYDQVGNIRVPGPTSAPVAVAETSGGGWVGPSPGGSFQYAITYIHGFREVGDEDFVSPYGVGNTDYSRHPLIESVISEPSAVAAITGTGQRVKITLPNPEFEHGFQTSTLRNDRSGLKIGVYRRRITANKVGSTRVVEPNMRWERIAILDADTEETFDTGALIPTKSGRYVPGESHIAIRVWPRPSTDYQLFLRAPTPHDTYYDDGDAIAMAPGATTAFAFLTAHFLLIMLGDSAKSQEMRLRFDDQWAMYAKGRLNAGIPGDETLRLGMPQGRSRERRIWNVQTPINWR